MKSALCAAAALAALVPAVLACSRADNQTASAPPAAGGGAPAQTASAPPASAPGPAGAAQPGAGGPQALVAQINGATFAPVSESTGAGGNATGGNATGGNATGASTGAGAASDAPQPMLIKAQVLLARADASPGVIDGQDGSNFKHAVAAYAAMNGLDDENGELTQEVWGRLTAGAPGPVAATYAITPQDVAGPYFPDVGEDMVKMSQLQHVGYSRPTEMLSERFHMSEDTLKALNPGADFGKAGTVIVIAQTGPIDLPKVDHIQVDKAHAAVRAYDKSDKMIAFMPATVGATDRPSPTGTHKVNGVAHDPTYTYDPSKLTWGPKSHGKFIVPSGPNNPVGVVWIDLNAPSYGLHGTPDPKEIGKTASHGCVRMTNWDALQLSRAVKPGVVVTFINSRAGAKSST